jgi:hypothetical protein
LLGRTGAFKSMLSLFHGPFKAFSELFKCFLRARVLRACQGPRPGLVSMHFQRLF